MAGQRVKHTNPLGLLRFPSLNETLLYHWLKMGALYVFCNIRADDKIFDYKYDVQIDEKFRSLALK